MKKLWPNLLALIVIYIAVLMGWQWVWGILFLMWTLPALYSGQIHLVSPVSKKDQPLLFWLIIATWIGLSLYLVVVDLLPLF